MLTCCRRRRWRPCAARAVGSLKPWWAVGLTLSFHDSPKLSRYFSLWRPLALLPSIRPVTTKFSRTCFLNMCPRKASCRWHILFVSMQCTAASLDTFSLLFFSIHNIFSILRKNQTSTAINLSFITFKIVHVSHPYNRTDQTQHCRTCSLVLKLTLWLRSTFFMSLLFQFFVLCRVHFCHR